MKTQNGDPQWPYSVYETLTLMTVVIVGLVLVAEFGLVYGSSIGVAIGLLVGLMLRHRRGRQGR
jgi:hypothetical protein